MFSRKAGLNRDQLRICALALVALVISCSAFFSMADGAAQPPLPTVDLQINGKVISAELATSSQQRYTGLSFRPALAEDAGMLFVYPSEQQLTFTMRNTLIPLSIAFISKDFVINEIHIMNVGPGQLFPSKKMAQYALEMTQGWFADNDITPGMRITMKGQ